MCSTVGFLQLFQKLARIRGEALDVAATPLGVQSIQSQTRLATAAHATECDQLAMRHLQIDVLQVVDPGAADLNVVMRHAAIPVRATSERRNEPAILAVGPRTAQGVRRRAETALIPPEHQTVRVRVVVHFEMLQVGGTGRPPSASAPFHPIDVRRSASAHGRIQNQPPAVRPKEHWPAAEGPWDSREDGNTAACQWHPVRIATFHSSHLTARIPFGAEHQTVSVVFRVNNGMLH